MWPGTASEPRGSQRPAPGLPAPPARKLVAGPGAGPTGRTPGASERLWDVSMKPCPSDLKQRGGGGSQPVSHEEVSGPEQPGAQGVSRHGRPRGPVPVELAAGVRPLGPNLLVSPEAHGPPRPPRRSPHAPPAPSGASEPTWRLIRVQEFCSRQTHPLPKTKLYKLTIH